MAHVENAAFRANRAGIEWLHIAPSAPFPPVEGSWNHLLWDLVVRSGGRQAIVGASGRLTAAIDDIELPFAADRPGGAVLPWSARASLALRRRLVDHATAQPQRTPSPLIAALPALGLGPQCRFMLWEKIHLLPQLRRRFPDAQIGFAQRAFPIVDSSLHNPYRHADLLVFQTVGQVEAVLRAEGSIDAITRVVPNGVETDRFRPPSTEEKVAARRALGVPDTATRVVLFASTLKAKKGTEVIRRLATWAAGQSGVHLVVAKGTSTMSGRELTHAEAFLETVEGNPAVTCLKGVDRSRMHLLYQASDLTVMPGLYLEGFSMVMLESLSCGVPVAAPRVPTFDELLEDGVNSLMFPPDDMFGRLVQIINEVDAHHLAELGSRGRAMALTSFQRHVALDGFCEAMAALDGD